MKKILAIVVLSIFPLLTALEHPAQASTLSDIYTPQNVNKTTLSNGMTVVLHESRKTPVATIELAVKTGSVSEGKFSGSGISHLMEHMLFKGKGQQCANKIKSLGGYINGYTSFEYTGYTITVPKSYVTDALIILKDFIFNFSITDDDLEKEKVVILDELKRGNDNNAKYAMKKTWELVFKRHPYRYPIIGYSDLFERLVKDDVENYYKTRYSPDNMILCVAGDINKDSLAEEIRSVYEGIDRNFLYTKERIDEPAQLGPRAYKEYRDISTAYVILAYRSASIADDSMYALDILATVLGGGESSILVKELRDNKRLVDSISCHNYTLQDSGIFYVYFTTDPNKVDNVTFLIKEKIEWIKKNGLNSADLKKAVKMTKANFFYALETADDRARDIVTSEIAANDYSFSQLYINKIPRVSSEDIESASEKYLKDDVLDTVMILPESCRPSKNITETKAPIEIASEKIKLNNGLTIIISEDHSIPILSISAVFLGGVRSENRSNNGITDLASSLLLCGTTKRTEEEIKDSIESRGGTIGTISGNNSFGITMDMISGEWSFGIELLGDIISNPVFKKKKIEKEKFLLAAAIKKRDDNIATKGLSLFRESFFGSHPYSLHPLGTIESLENITRKDIISHYNNLGVPENMVISVSGDIEKNKIAAEIKKTFKNLSTRKAKLPKLEYPDFKKGQGQIVHAMDREQSMVLIGFPSTILSSDERYTFEVIDAMMSGLSGRMHVNIRDKLGLSYSIGTSFMPGIEPGYFIFYALSGREHLETIENAILAEIDTLKSDLATNDEIEAAKAELITSQMLGIEKNSSLAMRTSLDELYGLGYDDFKQIEEEVDKVDAESILETAKKYFDVNNSLEVIIEGK